MLPKTRAKNLNLNKIVFDCDVTTTEIKEGDLQPVVCKRVHGVMSKHKSVGSFAINVSIIAQCYYTDQQETLWYCHFLQAVIYMYLYLGKTSSSVKVP